jgi:X-Pro dipeptidyl-peptidase
MTPTPSRPSARPRSLPSRRAVAAVALIAALTAGVAVPVSSAAAAETAISVVDGRTQPVFDYEGAVRERVFLPVPGVDQDLDGVTDVTAIDIIRPAESEGALDVPAIIDASPYYTTVGRGNESQLLTDSDGDGAADLFPLFYDNYFVPRGYAVIHAQMDGTGFSTGCPMHGGAGDIASMKVVIDWLQGRVAGYDDRASAVAASADALVVADWHNGKAGMIGKSYDGTLANGVAATGVDGLTTIVPIDAISDWYRYSRTNGIRHNTDYPASLSNTVTNPDRRALCAPVRQNLNAIDGDETGDMNPFWDERNYFADVDKVKASVFAVHGLNDDNVRMSQFAHYWEALGENGVARKVWLPRVGHVDPFDFRRAEWVDTLHAWFDHWLHGVANDVMSQPQSTVELGPSQYVDEAAWPAPGTEDVEVHLTGTPGTDGSLSLQPATGSTTLQFTGPANSPNETALIGDPTGSQASRLVLLSEPLTADLRISGTPVIQLDAALSQDQSNLGALLVDYSTAARTPRGSGDGVQNTTTRTCWGSASATDNACYLEVERRSATADWWRVSRGVLDSSNRDGIAAGQASPVVANQEYAFDYAMEPTDYVFAAGSRIGVVLTTNLSGFVAGSPGATLTLDAATSSIVLPVVGGLGAAVDSGALGTAAPVTLSFDLDGSGAPIADQSVAYGTAPTAPTAPVDDELFFAGWFADEARTIPFDFALPLTADTTVYAKWITLAERVARIEVTASDTAVMQGDTVRVEVQGFDAEGEELGDVTPWARLTSSVATDVIEGAEVTFPTASPHTLTATVNGVSDSVTVEVSPVLATPAPLPVTGGDGEATGEAGGLAATGMSAPVLPLTAASVLALLLGAASIVLSRRRLRTRGE